MFNKIAQCLFHSVICDRSIFRLVIVFSFLLHLELPVSAETYKIIRVMDGDSFIARKMELVRRFQLFAAQAPLLDCDQPDANESRKYLESLILGASVDIQIRTVNRKEFAIVRRKGRDISQLMIDSGWAWHQPQHDASQILADAQRNARAIGRGIWERKNPVAPWAYKQHLEKLAEQRRANLAYPWDIAPENTSSLVIVPNMQEFSDKLDAFATSLKLAPPNVIQSAIQVSGFDSGLRRDGNLMWWFKEDGSITYVIPSYVHTKLVDSFGRKYQPMMAISVDHTQYHVVDRDGYTLFARPSSKAWLQECQTLKGGFDKKIDLLNDLVKEQDFAMVTVSLESLVDFKGKLPFTLGKAEIPIRYSSLARMFPASAIQELTGTSIFAAGIRIQPNEHAELTIASSIDANSPIAKWGKGMKMDWRGLFAQVPNQSFTLVVGTTANDPWSSSLLNRLSLRNAAGNHIDILEKLINTFQGATLLLRSGAAEPIVNRLHFQLHFQDAVKASEWIKDMVTWELAKPGAKGVLVEQRIEGKDAFVVTEPQDPAVMSLVTLSDTTLMISHGPLQAAKTITASLNNPERFFDAKQNQQFIQHFSDSSRFIAVASPRLLEELPILSVMLTNSFGNLAVVNKAGMVDSPAVTLDLKLDGKLVSMSAVAWVKGLIAP